jgi:hypothetical protein
MLAGQRSSFMEYFLCALRAHQTSAFVQTKEYFKKVVQEEA